MKTLKDHVILYDEVCPMCNMYTKAFVTTQMLDKKGRSTYQNIPENIRRHVDLRRAVNEIALVNTQTGEATYGVESLLKILSNRFPFLKTVFQFKLFYWLAAKAYGFVSYNRRVIMPPTKAQKEEHEPAFKIQYRLLYLIVTWLITALILNAYSKPHPFIKIKRKRCHASCLGGMTPLL